MNNGAARSTSNNKKIPCFLAKDVILFLWRRRGGGQSEPPEGGVAHGVHRPFDHCFDSFGSSLEPIKSDDRPSSQDVAVI